MEGVVYKTREQLVQEWLEKFPEDAQDPSLSEMAVAGYVETKEGFVIFTTWQQIRNQRTAERTVE